MIKFSTSLLSNRNVNLKLLPKWIPIFNRSIRFASNDSSFSLTEEKSVSNISIPSIDNNYLPIQHPKLQETFIDSLPSVTAKNEVAERKQYIAHCADFPSLLQFYFSRYNEITVFEYHHLTKKLASLHLSGLLPPDIFESKAMQALCYNIWKKCPEFEHDIILLLYRDFLHIRVPIDSLLLQSLLQMMRYQINIHDLQNLLFMNRLLLKTPDCKIKTALLEALPYVIKNHVPLYLKMQFKFFEAWQLFQICFHSNIDEARIILDDILHEKLPQLLQENDGFHKAKNLKEFIIGIESLYHEEPHTRQFLRMNNVKILLQQCLEELIKYENISTIHPKQIFWLLQATHYLENNQKIESETFHELLQAISNLAIAKNWTSDDRKKLIKYLFNMKYHSDELACDSLRSVQNKISKLNIYTLTAFLEGISDVRYIPSDLNEAKNMLIEQIDQFSPEKYPNVHWMTVVLNALYLGVVPHKIIDEILSESSLKRYSKMYKYDQLQLVHSALKLLYPSHARPTIPEPYMSSMQSHVLQKAAYSSNFTLAIEEIVGKNNCISNLCTDSFSKLDHFMILDEIRRPIRLPTRENSSKQIFFKELNIDAKIPPERRIVLKEFPYLSPDTKLYSYAKLQCRILEKEGFTVIPIHYKNFNKSDDTSMYNRVGKLLQMNNINFRIY